MTDKQKQESDLIFVITTENYATRHKMSILNVLKLFSKKNIYNLLRSQYEVLHTLDFNESLEFVEDYLSKE
jgi:hypothetical protein